MKRYVLLVCFLLALTTSAYAETMAIIDDADPALIGGAGYDLTIGSNDNNISGLALMLTLCNSAMWAVRVKIDDQEYSGDTVTVWYQADDSEPVEETWNWHPDVSLAVGIVPKLLDDLETADRITVKVLNNQATFDLAAVRPVLDKFFQKCTEFTSP